MITLTSSDGVKKIAQSYDMGTIVEIKALKGGLINQTYYVKNSSGDEFVVQKLHKMFQKHLMQDIYAVTQHLTQKQEFCSELLQSNQGNLFCETDGNLWRAYKYISGKSFSSDCIHTDVYKNVGLLLGVLHKKLSLFQYVPKHVLEGFHDKNYYIKKAKHINKAEYPFQLQLVFDNVLANLEKSTELLTEKQQVIHGDPRVENILFTERCIPFVFIDYDTFMMGSIYIDIGDCLRSLLSLSDDMSHKQKVLAFLIGYNAVNIDEEVSYEKAVSALKYITSELCLRFIIDSVEKTYFSWDNARYVTQEAHNETRALEMWSFFNLLNKSL